MTSTTQVWSAELPARTQLSSFLVIGVGPGVVERRQLEDALVKDLSKRGVVAKPSYELFPYGVPEREAAREAALKAGIGGILTSRLRGIEDRRRYVPATETYFWGFEYGSYSRSNPGYYVGEEIVEFETTLWETRDGTKLWTATTRTENPASGKGFAGSLAKEVLPGMEKAGLLPREP